MKLKFSLVIGTTQECEDDEFLITSGVKKFLMERYAGKVFIKNMFLDKNK